MRDTSAEAWFCAATKFAGHPSQTARCGRRLMSASLKILYRALVLLGRGARLECAEISPPARLRILIARIKAVAARFKLANHRRPGTDRGFLERAKGFEPSTPTLARLCSTPELHPHP
jgi:hypothetical protein